MIVVKIASGLQSILLIAAVLLSGTHATEAIRPPASKHHVVATTYSDDGAAKVSTDLHNHIDKQSLKTLYHSNVQHYADRRSLTILEHSLQSFKTELKFGWSLWWRLAAAKLFL